nr:MAG: hypothetical protein [Bacteriophage sp.]
MPRKNKTIHISDMPSEFKGTVTKDGRFIKSGIPPLGGVYDKVAKTTGLIRFGNEFLYNGINNLIPRNDREQLMDNTAGRLVDYVKNFNKESFPNDEDLGPTFPFNIIQTPRTNGRNISQKQYATGGKVPNVVDGGIAHPLGNNFFYMNGRKHSQGGIDIGPSDKTGIEVEDGEIVETNGDELKVYSAQPIINGISPAKLVMGGANPNKVFKAQEDFKDRNKINDDGTIKAMGGLSRDKDYGSKKKPYPSVAKKDFAGGHRSYPIPTKADAIDALRLAGLHGRNDVKAKVYNKYLELRKKGSNGLIISINGNVKNGLLHSPSSTGGRHDKLIDGGRRTNPDSLKADRLWSDILKAGRLWSDSQLNKIKYLTDLRNSTRNVIAPTNYKINEPGRHSLRVNMPNQNKIDVNIPLNNLPPSNIPKGEEYINELIKIDNKNNIPTNESNYTRGYDGRVYYIDWDTGLSGEINYGTNTFNVLSARYNALENNKPQYYAERRLPLFNDGPAITSGLVRAGWSHGNNNKKYNVDNINIPNINIPNVNITKFKGQTPRRGGNKQSQSVKSIPTKTPPIAVYNRNLPKVEASIPTTLPVSTNTPAKGTTSFDGKGQGKFKNLTTADWIGLGSNVAGSLASYFASKRAINKMRGPGRPTLISANKLKTKYNINPQLDRIREDKFEAYRDIDSNTASSRVSLARKQRVRNAAGQAANELYGNKENIETNLINQDRRNQQSVRQFNAQQYNQYIDRKAAFDNGIREAKVTNINNLFSGINAGIQDMISRYENRKALNNTISAMRASAPNVDDRIMRDAGVDYDEFIIRKRRKLGGKQSCR